MKKFIGRLFLILLILPWALKSGAPADRTDKGILTAEQILSRLAKVYANCKSYHDSGSVKDLFVGKEGDSSRELLFTTAFVRPDRFRFEYTEKSDGVEDLCIIWRNGKHVLTWWKVAPGIKTADSLGEALAGVTGVSRESASLIPAMLLPKEVDGGGVADWMSDARRIEDAKLGKVDCFRIVGKSAIDLSSFKPDSATVWIEKKSFLLRRIDKQMNVDGTITGDTITYTPEVDGNVPDKMLLFNPPGNDK